MTMNPLKFNGLTIQSIRREQQNIITLLFYYCMCDSAWRYLHNSAGMNNNLSFIKAHKIYNKYYIL